MDWLSDKVIDRLRTSLDAPDLTGTPYALGRELGRGGMGTVYEAYDPRLERAVALKVLSPLDDGAEAVERLWREARVLARLEHPGIVPVHDVGMLPDGRPYYAMKRVEGRRLDEYLATSPVAGRVMQGLPASVRAGGVRPRPRNRSSRSEAGEHHARPVSAKYWCSIGASPNPWDRPNASGLVIGTAGYIGAGAARRRRRSTPAPTSIRLAACCDAACGRAPAAASSCPARHRARSRSAGIQTVSGNVRRCGAIPRSPARHGTS